MLESNLGQITNVVFTNPLTLQAPASQNGQKHSSNCLSVFDHFVGLALKTFRKVATYSNPNECTLSHFATVPMPR